MHIIDNFIYIAPILLVLEMTATGFSADEKCFVYPFLSIFERAKRIGVSFHATLLMVQQRDPTIHVAAFSALTIHSSGQATDVFQVPNLGIIEPKRAAYPRYN